MTDSESILGMEAEKGRWALVFIGMVINLCLGSIYSWSIFVGPLLDLFNDPAGLNLGVGRTEVLMPFTVFLAVFALAMPLTGPYIEKFGPKKVTLVGGVLTALGWFLASTVTQFSNPVSMLYVMYSVIAGLGVGIAYGCPVAVAARWFPDKRGTAVGFTVLGFGFSAVFTAALANYFIASTGVLNTFRLFGIAFLIIIVVLSMPLTFPPAGWKPRGWTPPAAKPGAHVTVEFKRDQMVKSPQFIGLWLCYTIGCMAGLMAISVSKPVGTEVVMVEAGLATGLVSFFAIFNGFGRPIFGTLTDKINPRNTAMVSFVLIALASVMMYMAPSVPVYIIAFAILWGCLGGWLAIGPTSTATFFGTTDYARNYGLVFTAYGAGAILGPMLAGYIRDATGSYMGVFPYIIGVAVIGFAIAFVLMRPPKPPA
ncbi:MAG: OFA family MFS transporter [Methanotrichaceae archaeon]|nr:OFA family MFS transporter [Methanotrichaceae archaeon]